ncbi:restriction endonuclease [Microvirga sp. STR05]|uniref:restriction endonuclease n=1 Tax=Hymenobacter duratus TaxID=2771356 RepID=UPI001B8B464A|nr:restriction endonuclease [Hymenobacter duratus]MBR7950384.1 restriction endonuclease [Microvirga sp. STR05]
MPRRNSRPSTPSAPGPAGTPAETRCALCERQVQHTSRHHLVPREEGGRHGPTADLCQPCHSTIHLLLDNKELARCYHTIDALRTAEPLQKYLHWVRRSRVERIANRRGRR